MTVIKGFRNLDEPGGVIEGVMLALNLPDLGNTQQDNVVGLTVVGPDEDDSYLHDICANLPESQEVLVFAASPVGVEHPKLSVIDLYLPSDDMLFEAVLEYLEVVVSENLMRASGEHLTRYVCHNCSWVGIDQAHHAKLAKFVACSPDSPIAVLEGNSN